MRQLDPDPPRRCANWIRIHLGDAPTGSGSTSAMRQLDPDPPRRRANWPRIPGSTSATRQLAPDPRQHRRRSRARAGGDQRRGVRRLRPRRLGRGLRQWLERGAPRAASPGNRGPRPRRRRALQSRPGASASPAPGATGGSRRRERDGPRRQDPWGHPPRQRTPSPSPSPAASSAAISQQVRFTGHACLSCLPPAPRSSGRRRAGVLAHPGAASMPGPDGQSEGPGPGRLGGVTRKGWSERRGGDDRPTRNLE
jgi:hypothetical protein